MRAVPIASSLNTKLHDSLKTHGPAGKAPESAGAR